MENLKTLNTKFISAIGVILITCICQNGYGQEQLLPLTVNPVLKNSIESPATLRTAVSLPFRDDFSYQTSYPDPNLWVGQQVFVNTTFPINPVSIGVVSLDGLKQNGEPYDSISYNFYSIGGADTLTSQPILLGSNSPADSLWFSFFYQPGGLGDPPNTHAFNLSNYGVDMGDSLILEFKDVNGSWRHLWAHDGESLQPFVQVMIPLKDAGFFHDNFQFRFRNIASLIGQYDVWNIDYVHLAAGRNFSDTSITDVAIQFLPTSILKNYEAMPWNQFQDFQVQEQASGENVWVKNNFNSVKNTSYQLNATELITNTPLFNSGVSGTNLDPESSTAISFSSFPIGSFSVPDDSVVIATQAIIGATGDNNTSNDTVTRSQVFYNYEAYDDGSPEAIYRLLGSPAGLAYQFHLNTPDTLRGIEVLFAHTDVNILTNLFSIYVWKGLNPEDSLLRDELLLPEFVNERNGFSFYRLSRPLLISDTFYIGWLQVSLQTDMKIDVGFDLNDTSNQHLWYNIDGTWQQSGLKGALMMRPVLGSSIPFGIGINEAGNENSFSIFPNPSSDFVYVKGGSDNYTLEILDLAGRTISVYNRQSSVDIRNLPSGVYLMRIDDLHSGKMSIKKFIKTN